ncbi:MAG: hypothetical protein Tsb0010_01420 [Parvularculaceae bacterium]
MTLQRSFIGAACAALRAFIHVLLICGWAVVALAAAGRASAQTGTGGAAVFLKPEIAVAGRTVTLADIFADAGEAGSVKVANAPQPGASISLDPEYLRALARRHGLAWANANNEKRIVITRRSQTINADEIADAIAREIAALGLAANYDVRLANTRISLHAPIDAAARPAVAELSFDRASGRFAAKIAAYDGGPVTTVAGRAEPMMAVPSLLRPVGRGDVIREADLEWIRLPAARASATLLTDINEIAGMAARRPLAAGAQLRRTDLETPKIVAKGAVVRMVYEQPGLKVTMLGRALADAAKGELINVQNVQSHRTVQAVAVSPDTVMVAEARLPASF